MRFPRFIVSLLLVVSNLSSHDLYILPAKFFTEGGRPANGAIHNGDSFPESEAGPVLERIRDARVISAKGLTPLRDLLIDGKRATFVFTPPASGDYLLTVRTIPNFISMKAADFRAYLKEEGLDDVIKWREEHGVADQPSRERYRKYAKSLLVAGRGDGFYRHEVGLTIEIVPELDPARLEPGGKLPARILFRGKPAAGLQIEAAWAAGGQSKTVVVGRTDSSGRISVPLEKHGLWRIHTLKMERCTEPAIADWESYWASLTFELRMP